MYQHDFNEAVDGVEENSLEVEKEGTSWNKVHVSMSFCVGCTMEGVEMCHVSSKVPRKLVSQFVDILLEMAEKKVGATVEQYKHILNS